MRVLGVIGLDKGSFQVLGLLLKRLGAGEIVVGWIMVGWIVAVVKQPGELIGERSGACGDR